jgi:hypothetical protein
MAKVRYGNDSPSARRAIYYDVSLGRLRVRYYGKILSATKRDLRALFADQGDRAEKTGRTGDRATLRAQLREFVEGAGVSA